MKSLATRLLLIPGLVSINSAQAENIPLELIETEQTRAAEAHHAKKPNPARDGWDTDTVGNSLDTTSAIVDDTTLSITSVVEPIPIAVSYYFYDGTGRGSGPSSSFPDAANTELTNGILPASTSFSDPEWVGYQDGRFSGTPATVDHPQITFDMGSVFSLSTIDVTYLHSTSQADGTKITAPDELLISTSTHNSSYSSPVSFTTFDNSAGDEIRTTTMDVSALSDARFIRLEFRQSSRWTFLSEVEFFGTSDPMNPSPPHGATVPIGEAILSWTNLSPDSSGDPVFVDVWFGTDSDKTGMNYTKIVNAGEDTNSVTINVPLEGTFFWQIDSFTGGAASGAPTGGKVYSFNAQDIPTLPDITITVPASRHIVQRSSLNTGEIAVAGSVTGIPDTIEARVVVMAGVGNSGTTSEWQTIQSSPFGGKFSSVLTGVPAGGWYQLEVRSVTSAMPGTAVVMQKIGVGDIYITAGQSNSANHGTGGYVANDDRVNARSDVSGGSWIKAADPIPIATGGGGSVWTRLGDELAATSDVPIGFVAVGVGGTPVGQWIPGSSFYNNRLRPAIQSFPTGGFRAVLWHQGESDAFANVIASTHESRLNSIISQSRLDAGWDVPWYLAEAAFHHSANLSQEEPVTAGQRQAVYGDPLVFLGPSTDQFHQEEKLSDEVHFNSAGLLDHAQQWRDILQGTSSMVPRNHNFEDNGVISDGEVHIVTTDTNNSPSVIGWRILSSSGNTAANGNNGFHNPTMGTYGAAIDSNNNGILTNMAGRHVARLDGGTADNYFLSSTRALAEPNKVYTLTVALGIRDNPANFGKARLELLANNVVVATNRFDKASLDVLRGTDVSGTFTNASISWTTGDSISSNQPLSIRIFKEGGTGSVIDFDNVRLTSQATNDFAAWINNFGIAPEDQRFALDPDDDGLANGLESWLGTHPGLFNRGISKVSIEGKITTFSHPQNDSSPVELTGVYMWSSNLVDWFTSNNGPDGGPTITLNSITAGTLTTITATASAPLDNLFLRLAVTRN